MLSSNTVICARRRRSPRGGVSVLSLTWTVVALLSIQTHVVMALNCGNRIYRSARKFRIEREISQSCMSFTDDRTMMSCHIVNPRIDLSSHREAFRRNSPWMNVLRLSTKDDDIALQQTNLISTEPVKEASTLMNGASKRSINRSSLSRTLVLAVPLMLKFALVLMIKFLTDLVVFPLLFAYRGTRIMKRRISKLWNRWTSSPSSMTGEIESNKNIAPNLEKYSVNGSSPTSESS